MRCRFDGHRIYDGCPDSTMQRRLDEEDRLVRQMQELCPTARCTYYPVEQMWMAWDSSDYSAPIVEGMFHTKMSILHAAIAKLKERA